MGVSVRTVAWLRNRGFDAVHLREQGLQRISDEAILVKATAEGRVVLTMDLGFGELLSASGAGLPSVVLFRLSDERPAVVNQRLADVIDRCEADLGSGAIVSVGEQSIRVRRLPIVRL